MEYQELQEGLLAKLKVSEVLAKDKMKVGLTYIWT
jgi:hypothetical protein